MLHKALLFIVFFFSFCSKYHFSIKKICGESIKKYETNKGNITRIKTSFIVAQNNKVFDGLSHKKNLFSDFFSFNYPSDERTKITNFLHSSKKDFSNFNKETKQGKREKNSLNQDDYSDFEVEYEDEEEEDEDEKRDDNTSAIKLHRRSFSRGNRTHRRIKSLRPSITIPLYTAIFVAAWVGNILVILTVLRLRRMRTVTNIYLLNLSVTDIIFASICMPLTLIPTLMQDFVFGSAVCVLVRYLQCKWV